MGILGALIIGLIAGALAKLVMPGRDPGGILITMALGVLGSLLAGFLGRALGWYEPSEGAGLIGSFVGAVLVLGIYRVIAGRRIGATRPRV